MQKTNKLHNFLLGAIIGASGLIGAGILSLYTLYVKKDKKTATKQFLIGLGYSTGFIIASIIVKLILN